MAEELSAKILIQPDESSAASQKFTRRLNEMLAKIPDSKLPRIAVQIDVNRTKSVFQKQLKDIMKSMSLDTSSLYKSGSGSGSKSISVVNDLKLEAKQIRDIERASLNLQKIRAKLIKQQKEVYQEAKKTMRRDTNVGNLYDEFLGYTNKNVNYKKKSYFLKEAQDLRKELSDAFYNGTTEENFIKLQNRVTRFQTQMKEAGLEAETWGQRIRRLFKDHFNTAIAMAGIHLLKQSLQQMIGVVQELDKQVVNLQMATGSSRSYAVDLLSTYNKMGKELGATTAEVSEAANSFLRQGKSIEETNTLIKDSMILSKVGMIDSASATAYLTSAMKGYKLSTQEVLGVVDKLTAVDLLSATDAGGLAEAMAKTANSARLAGISMNQLLGYIASTAEVTQAEMSSVGTTFKTIFARMSNIKLGKLEDEDGENITEYLSDAEQVLDRVGIKLRSSATEFNNFGDVFDKIGSKWDSLSEIEKSTIATAFGGTRQKEQVLTLFENYGNALKYTEAAANSAGTALEKFEAYQSGLEKSTKSFTAAFEEVSTTFLNSGFLKGIIDLGSGLLNLISSMGGLVPLLTIIGGLLLALKVDTIFSFGKGIVSLIGNLGKLPIYTTVARNGMTTFTMATKTAAISVSTLQLAIGALVAAFTIFTIVSNNIKQAHEEHIAKVKEMATAADEETKSLNELIKKYKELKEKGTLDESSRIEVKSIQEQITKLVGDQAGNLDLVNGGLDKELKKLKDIAIEQAKVNHASYVAAYQLAKSSSDNATGDKSTAFGLSSGWDYASSRDKSAEKILKDSGITGLNIGSGAFGTPKTFISTTGSAAERVQQLNSAINALENSANYDITTSPLYSSLVAARDRYQGLVTATQEATDALNANIAVIAEAKVRESGLTVDSVESYNKYKQAVIDAVMADKTHVGTLDDVSKQVDILMSERFPQFAAKIDNTTRKVDNSVDSLKSLSDIFKTYKDKISSLEDAQNDLNEHHNLSSDTIKNLIENYKDLEAPLTEYIVGLRSEESFLKLLKSTQEDVSKSYIDQLKVRALAQDKNVIALANAYGIDLSNFKSVESLKQSLLVDSLTNQYNITDENVNEKAKAYNVDLTNFKTVEAKKIAVLNEVKRQQMDALAQQYAELPVGDEQRAELKRQWAALNESLIDDSTIDDIIAKFESAKKWTPKLPSSGIGSSSNTALQNYLAKIEHYKALGKYENKELQYISDLQYAHDTLAKTKEEKWDLEEKIYQARKVYEENQLKLLEDAQKAILSLQDLVMNKIKKQKDLEKEALKEKLDGFKKEADARKNALRQLKDQHNYEKTVAEKEKSISEIKRQLIALDADDSAWATRRKLELNEQLSEKQADLDDYLYDQNIQRQEEQIDAWYEKQENSINNQLKNIEHYLENQELLMSDSMKAINGMSEKLYKDLVAYNKSYGDGIESTVKKAWEDAEKALESYGTKANAIKTFDSIEKQIIKNAEGKPIDSKPSSGSSSSGSTTTPKTPKKGEIVTVEKSASTWATGQSIASFVKGGKYEVIQVNKDGTTVIGRNGVVTGRIKNTDLVGYKTGGVNTTTGLHMLHGSNANSEVVFNSTDAKKLFNLVNNTDNLSKLLAEKLSLKVPAVTAGNGGFNYNVDITIQGNVNDDTIKKLEDTSRKLFGEFKSQFNKDLRSRGFGTAIKI